MTTITNPLHLEVIKDYRQAAKVEHILPDIILLTFCGVLSVFDTWEGIGDFGDSRSDFLKSLGRGALRMEFRRRILSLAS